MLINGWSGSGGDAFPTYFKQAGIGPLIGTRTWGGLIGISGAPALVDGGNVTRADLPHVRPEGHLVRAKGTASSPTSRSIDDPSQLAEGDRPAARARDQGSAGPDRKGADGAGASRAGSPHTKKERW